MFGLGFRLKVKFWLLVVQLAACLLAAVERQARKSVGLVQGGVFTTNSEGKILAGVMKIGDEEITVFGPN